MLTRKWHMARRQSHTYIEDEKKIHPNRRTQKNLVGKVPIISYTKLAHLFRQHFSILLSDVQNHVCRRIHVVCG